MSNDHDRWRSPNLKPVSRPSPFVTDQPDDEGARPAAGWGRRSERVSEALTPLIEVQEVTREFPIGDHVVRALRGIDMRISRGHLVAIKGRSGSGKTTLLNIIGGLDRPTGGKVLIDGVEVSAMPENELINLRRHKIGFIFQAFG